MFKVNPSWLGLLATGAVFHLESSGVVDESDIVRQEMIPVRKTEKLPSYISLTTGKWSNMYRL